MTVTERERRRMELVDGSAHRTELCEQLAMREYELDNLKKENAKLCELLLRSYESFEEVYDRCDIDDSWRMETALEDMRACMHKLGVEVSE